MKLKIEHHPSSPDRHRVELSIDDDSGTKVGGEFDFSFTSTDQERLRWYWEDFLDYPIEPARDEVPEAERRIEEIGTELFQAPINSGCSGQSCRSCCYTPILEF